MELLKLRVLNYYKLLYFLKIKDGHFLGFFNSNFNTFQSNNLLPFVLCY